MTYQPHIDGIRAIAVLSVIFFHLGIGDFSGGYVGVDIFFVISGYLISSIIIATSWCGIIISFVFEDTSKDEIISSILEDVFFKIEYSAPDNLFFTKYSKAFNAVNGDLIS